MKNRLVRFGALATAILAIGAYASPAAAFPKNLAYTFGTTSGSSYCDGLTLTSTDKLAYYGFHVNDDCAGSNDPAEGLVVRLGGHKVIEVITGVASQYPNLAFVFYIDPTALTWDLYINEYYLDGTSDYIEINSGNLIKGAPPAGRGGQSSLHPKPGVKLAKPFFP